MRSFLKELFSSTGTVSSKRVTGALALVASIAMVYTGIDTEIIKAFLMVSTTLLGVSVASEIAKVNKNEKGKK